jgi:hypothetical protein
LYLSIRVFEPFDKELVVIGECKDLVEFVQELFFLLFVPSHHLQPPAPTHIHHRPSILLLCFLQPHTRYDTMIRAILIINNHGKPRLTKFYEQRVRSLVMVVV